MNNSNQSNILILGLRENNGNLKMILVDLIEEDFTSRAFDNIKALNTLAKVVLDHYENTKP